MSVEASRRLRAPARRALIVDSALEAFAAKGYRATGMGEIADAAGVTRAVVYDHFPSKKALFLALLEETNAFFLGHVGARITGEGSAEVRMRATVDAVFAFAERHPQAWRLLFASATHGDPDVDAAWRELHEARAYAVATLLAADARDAGIDSRGLEIIVEMLVASLRGAVEWWQSHRGIPRAELTDTAMDLLWAGLGTPATSRAQAA